MDRMHEIPEPFYREETGIITVSTVGELKQALSHLPDDLPIDDENKRLVVPNINTSPFLTFEEPDF